MDSDETWQVGLRPEKTKHCTFPGKSRYGLRRSRARKNGSQRRCFCDVYDAPLLPLFLDRFPPNFPWTRVHVLARDTWFHIPEKFPLRGRICRNTLFLGYPLLPGYGSRETFCDAYTVSIPWWTSHRCDLPIGDFCWGMCRLPAIHVRTFPFATVSAMGDSGAPWREAGHQSIGR